LEQYSDSLIYFFKQKNDTANSIRCIKIADSLLKTYKQKDDTIYADFLYRKAVIISTLGEPDTLLLKKSLSIWEECIIKNDVKLMKIFYFLGNNYAILSKNNSNENYYDSCNLYLSKSFKLIKSHSLQSISNYKGILHTLALINYWYLKDFKLASYYSQEYIDFTQISGLDIFDFNYVDAFKFMGAREKVEEVLKSFIDKYYEIKKDSPEILFKIYFELVSNKFSNEENKINFNQEILDYGIKAIDLYEKSNLSHKLEYSLLCTYLVDLFNAKNDKENAKKYRILDYLKKYKNEESNLEDQVRYYFDIEDLSNFKKSFDKYENELIKENNYNDLLGLYKYSIDLFARNKIFTKEIILNQIDVINQNRSNLTNDNKVILNLTLAKTYIICGMFSKALSLCNENLYVPSIKDKLDFYYFKSIGETSLGKFEDAKNSIDSAINIASNYYGKDDVRILPLYSNLITLDIDANNNYLYKLANKIIKSIYEAKLEKKTETAQLWSAIGTVMLRVNNTQDAYNYFQKAIEILDNDGPNRNPFYYYSTLLQLASVSILRNNYDQANFFLKKAKKSIDSLSWLNDIASADYYQTLGFFNFYQDKFYDANESFQKSLKLYKDSTFGEIRLYSLLCEYFNSGDYHNALAKLEKQYKENKGYTFFLYLFNYGLKDKSKARDLLFDQLNMYISESSQYYHLFSTEEKENLYKNNSIYFELLNSYLEENDNDFLNQYIKLRFYSKAILQESTFNSNYDYRLNSDLLSEYKNNNNTVNKAIENNLFDTLNIEILKSRNREIERLIPKEIKPLELPDTKKLQNVLKADEAYIEIVRINKQNEINLRYPKELINYFSDKIFYGAIIIRKDSAPKFIFLDTTNNLELKYSKAFKLKVASKEKDEDSYKYLFEKLDLELNDVNKIYIVNDGIYHTINLESIYNPKRGKFIIDYLKIEQITNINRLINKFSDAKINPDSKFILFGNPKYNIEQIDSITIPVAIERGIDDSAILEIKNSIKLSPLQGTHYEILNIKEKLDNYQYSVQSYTADSASEENIKNISSPYLLHIACHGYFLNSKGASSAKSRISNIYNRFNEIDPYLRSGLLLAGAENTLNYNFIRNNMENGILTASEVKELNLKNTELVILSACETGLGTNIVGEGVIGLPRAFMIAGAKKVIMSLWPISDIKTQQMMIFFYNNWIVKKMNIEDALYVAKKEIKQIFPEPYYWAGFVLIQ
jgi:CHAT domain-containing protein